MGNSERETKISFAEGNICDFTGDGIICPSYTNLTYFHQVSGLLRLLINKAGNGLVKELSAISFCNMGNVVITKGYNLNVKNIIFLPNKDNLSSESINFILLHQAIKNAFNLAVLYDLKRIAIAPIHLEQISTHSVINGWKWFGIEENNHVLTPTEVIDVIIGVFKEYSEHINELIIYKGKPC